MNLCQETILILHGWGGSYQSWLRIQELLTKAGYCVIVPDLPGFGKSAAPKNSWSVDNYVEWVKEFCDKQNLSQFFLLGHSFGGRIAIKFAAKYPKKLKGLILNSAAGITPRPKIKISIFCFLSKICSLIFSLPVLKFLRPLTLKIVYRFGVGRDYQLIQTSAMRETFKKVIEEDLVVYLSQISLPTLIVWGAKDKMTPISDAYKMNKLIKNSKLKIILNGRHGLHISQPDELYKIIREFLD